MTDTVAVATSGTIDRDDKCARCGHGLIFRVNDDGKVTSKFCGNTSGDTWCPKVFVVIPEMTPRPATKEKAMDDQERIDAKRAEIKARRACRGPQHGVRCEHVPAPEQGPLSAAYDVTYWFLRAERAEAALATARQQLQEKEAEVERLRLQADFDNGLRSQLSSKGLQLVTAEARITALESALREARGLLAECLSQQPHAVNPPNGCLCRWCKSRRFLAAHPEPPRDLPTATTRCTNCGRWYAKSQGGSPEVHAALGWQHDDCGETSPFDAPEPPRDRTMVGGEPSERHAFTEHGDYNSGECYWTEKGLCHFMIENDDPEIGGFCGKPASDPIHEQRAEPPAPVAEYYCQHGAFDSTCPCPCPNHKIKHPGSLAASLLPAPAAPDPVKPKGEEGLCPECGALSDRCFIHPQPEPRHDR